MSEDAKPLLSPLPTDTERTKPQGQGKYSLGPNRISFPPSSTSALYAGEDPDEYDLRTSGYRPTPTRNRSANNVQAGPRQTENGDLEARRDARPGLPKLSRECLWSEFKCYGTYIFPVLFVFGVLAIGISLSIFGWKKGWFDK